MTHPIPGRDRHVPCRRRRSVHEATASTENERTVLEFLGLWEKRDASLLLPYFTPTGSYIDTPLPPRHGIDEIKTYIEAVFGGFSVRIETLKIASAGDLVFTERTDRLGAEGKPEVLLPVAGVMELKDGKIGQWREYLDLSTTEEGLGIKLK